MTRDSSGWARTINIIRGKGLAGALAQVDITALFTYIDTLEEALDEADEDDLFGTEGWRHRILGDD